MKIKITKPDSVLYEGSATLVQLPGTGGKFEILNDHAPIISSLAQGQLRLVDEGGAEHLFDIRGGVVEVSKDKVLLLAE